LASRRLTSGEPHPLDLPGATRAARRDMSGRHRVPRAAIPDALVAVQPGPRRRGHPVGLGPTRRFTFTRWLLTLYTVRWVTEREEAYSELRDLGVLDAVRWAQRSAYQRAYHDHEEEAGHTQGTFGYVATTLLEDRLDRVFSTGRYAIDEAPSGEDVRIQGLLPDDAATLPAVPAGLVRRADLQGSPGWRVGRWRFLLVKTEFGNVDGYRWAPAGPVRQSVARQPQPDQLAFLLDSIPHGWITDPPEQDAGGGLRETSQPPVVLMVAHSGDRRTGERELYLGRSRWNGDGGPPWHWLVDLIADGGRFGVGRLPAIPTAAAPPRESVQVDDAPVRLRPAADRRAGGDGWPA
jgi:hypothetical protein